MRVPGLSSFINFGRNFRFGRVNKYKVTTVAALMSVSNPR